MWLRPSSMAYPAPTPVVRSAATGTGNDPGGSRGGDGGKGEQNVGTDPAGDTMAMDTLVTEASRALHARHISSAPSSASSASEKSLVEEGEEKMRSSICSARVKSRHDHLQGAAGSVAHGNSDDYKDVGEGDHVDNDHGDDDHDDDDHIDAGGSANSLGGGGSIGPRGGGNSGRGRRRRREPEKVDIRVPVTFKQRLSPEIHAALLNELLRHVLFSRGQIPMPYQQLLEILKEREAQDEAAKARRAARLTDEVSTFSTERQGGRETEQAGRGARGVGNRGGRGSGGGRTRNGRRELARATAHRRARKAMAALQETMDCIQEVFAHIGGSGRHVHEALIVMGASHLSPREIYSVTFTDVADSSSLEDAARGSQMSDACSRKMVRTLIGGTSGVVLPRLSASRVHIFLRILDFHPAPALTIDAKQREDDHPAVSVEPPGPPITHTGVFYSGGTPAPIGGSLPHLNLRPDFKIRMSRSRPAPKISIVIGRNSGGCGASGTGAGQQSGLVGVGGVELEQSIVRSEVNNDLAVCGRWHQLIGARLVGLRGCDTLASWCS